MSFFKTKRFLPLFLTQFFGAFNDNLFKNGLVMLITYRLAEQVGGNVQVLITVASGLFILPYFLFSATAGQIADKYERSKIVRVIKVVEIVLMLLAAFGFMTHNVWFLMVVLFGMGVHSTFFGPLKYALLPQHLQPNELLSGNAYIEAGTFLAILLGTIAGGLLILYPQGEVLVSGGIILFAVIGYLTSRAIPKANAPDPGLIIRKNVFVETGRLIRDSAREKTVFRCIMGISWFWFVGATFLSQFPSFAKDVVHADQTVVTLFLTLFSVGVGAGSFLCNKLLKGRIQATYVPAAAIGLSLFAFDLFYVSSHSVYASDMVLTGFRIFLTRFEHVRLVFDLFMIGLCGGIYIVPLYAMMQEQGDKKNLARLIAANNVMNALFMVASALMVISLVTLKRSIPDIFLIIAVLNGLVAIYICRLLPDVFQRSVARLILRLLFRVEVKGTENYFAAGRRTLVVANHTSFLDAAVIAAFLPEKITFAINTNVAKKWWVKPTLALVNVLPLDPGNPLAAKAMIEKLRNDEPCMIFPEGRITVTGSLMKIYEGPGLIADKAGARILPVRIDGGQFSKVSRMQGKLKLRWFPKITMTILPHAEFALPEEATGRRRRQLAALKLYDIMSDMMFLSSHHHQTLFKALLEARDTHGGKHLIVEDIERKPLSYTGLVTAALALGAAIDDKTRDQQNVAILLPNAVGTAVTFFALQSIGKTAAMLNFTAGGEQLATACRTALVKTVLTSRRFIELGKLDKSAALLEQAGVTLVYLEDLRSAIGLPQKLAARLKAAWINGKCADKTSPDAAAVILFTSGSEGAPKGVVLSHANLLSNLNQVAARVDFSPADKVFNCLPMFHAFGLTGGTVLPIIAGLRTFFYPSPLHYRIVPELVYDTNATVLFGTDTFLAGYARMANPYDLRSLRFVVAGAEKLKDETRKAFMEKFGLRVFEGYGATETAPVISLNTPMFYRLGTVGRILPSIESRLEPVPGINEGGKLWVKGPNVMQGYLRAENPGVLEPLADGWYDTGDVVTIDADGFMAITGRMKRFAKIAGEMISLSAVEAGVNGLWPEALHAAINLPDDKKGEQIILLTTQPDAERGALNTHFKATHMPDLAMPKKIIVLEKMPLLGTGKIDHVAAREFAMTQIEPPKPTADDEEEDA